MMVSWAVHVTREVGANESQLSQDESTHCILQGSHLRSEGQAPQIWVSFWLWSFASPSKSLSAWVARHLSGMLATFILPDDNVRGLHVDRARNHRVYRDGQYWCDCNDNLAELELLIDSYRSLLSDCILFHFPSQLHPLFPSYHYFAFVSRYTCCALGVIRSKLLEGPHIAT